MNIQSKKQQNPKDKQYILLSYRSEIQKVLPTTYYTSDSGWGCMLRVGQMLIANLIYQKENASIKDVIRLFYDNLDLPFSIQTITKYAKELYPQRKQYDWFSPCQMGFIIKKLLQDYDSFYKVNICNDNSMFLNEIEKDRKKILLITMCRIGLNQPQLPYLQCVIRLTKNPYFLGIMGGTPKRAHLFLGHLDGKFGYLDPHRTLKTQQNVSQMENHQEQYISKLSWLNEKMIDTSMAICFQMQTNQLQSFWQSIQKLKAQLGNNFFIYIEKEKPQFDEGDIIQIVDDDFQP